MTYYLKYRPQTLDELDEKAVRETLSKVAALPEPPHAFLFSGPKGTGKTSAARIYAKVVNCENKKGINPCNECETCISISKGQNLDVIELDAASHRGIEDIRAIRDAVKLAPAKAKKKIYIMDEAHMLTAEASNALLKMLEEPPSHVVFILATTNPEKLLGTIRSRTLEVNFKKATKEEIVESLQKISKGEKLKIDKESLELIASAADGSFRDAHKIFEQLVSELPELTREAVEIKLLYKDVFDTEKFLKIISAKDAKEAIALLESAVESGVSAKDISNKIIETLRTEMLSRVIDDKANLRFLEKTDVTGLLKLFSETAPKIAESFIEQVPLEIAVIDWCENEANIKKDKTGGSVEPEQTSSKSQTPKKANESNDQKPIAQEESYENSKKDADVNDSDIIPASNGDTKNIENQAVDIPKEIDDRIWSAILSKVKPGHTSTEALLRAAKPINFDGSVLKLGVYYKFHKEHLEGTPHRDILESALEEALGSKIRVVCTLTEPPERPVLNPDDFESPVSGSSVVLTEPKEPELNQRLNQNSALTGSPAEDIIQLAEKIFSS